MPEGSGPKSPLEEARSLLWEKIRLMRLGGSYEGSNISDALERVEREAIAAFRETVWDCSGCGKQDVKPLDGYLADSHNVPGEPRERPPGYCGPLEVRHG